MTKAEQAEFESLKAGYEKQQAYITELEQKANEQAERVANLEAYISENEPVPVVNIEAFEAKIKQDRFQRGYCQPSAVDADFEAAVEALKGVQVNDN
jgi:hypothetical protein